jgi:hypothetical protein
MVDIYGGTTMKLTQLKTLIRECVQEIREEWEPYDDKTDSFGAAPEPRLDKTGGTPSPNDELLKWAQNRLERESNENNRWALTKVIDMLKREMGGLKESGSPEGSYFPTLSDALKSVEEYIIKNQIQVDPNEHPSNEADQFGVREPFNFGGIPYEKTREAHYKLAAFKGKPTKKYLHVSIYQMPSGSYELTRYIS